jgi:hypothetical protein
MPISTFSLKERRLNNKLSLPILNELKAGDTPNPNTLIHFDSVKLDVKKRKGASYIN